MKASWRGCLCLGELTVPIRLYSAVRSISPRFVQIHAKDNSPVKRAYKCQKEDKEISSDEIVRAVSIGGKYVEVTEADIRSTAVSSKDAVVRQFSDPTEINPAYYEKPYYIVPGKGGELAYSLLRQAFVRASKIAIVTYMLYEKEHIGVIAPNQGVLMLQQLRFADELVPRSQVRLPSIPQAPPDKVEVAVAIMQRYSSPFYVEDYRNEQVDRMNEVIERKVKGLSPRRQPKVSTQTTPENKIMLTLRALLESRGQRLLDEPKEKT